MSDHFGRHWLKDSLRVMASCYTDVSLRVSSCCLVLISFVTNTANSEQSSCDESRSPSGNCFTSGKRRQLHSFVTTLNTHFLAKLRSCLVSVRPRLNLISNHRRRSGPRGSVTQREFLVSHSIQYCSAATGTLTGMGTCWQSDKNATTDPTTSHQHDIGVAPMDALHAISNETSKAGTHPSQSTGEACEGSFTRNSGRPLDSTQARESLTVPSYFFSPYFSSLFACLFTSKIPRSLYLSAYSHRFALTYQRNLHVFTNACPHLRRSLYRTPAFTFVLLCLVDPSFISSANVTLCGPYRSTPLPYDALPASFPAAPSVLLT
jgi:hypothetical protein